MARFQAPVYAVNGGEVGREALSRLDLQRLQYAGELYQNIFPKVIGSFQMRGGFQYIADSAVNEAGNRFIKFVIGTSDNAVLQFSSDGMRIINGDGYQTRPAVTATIQNGDFSSFTGWTDESTAVATADVAGGQLRLTGAAGSVAIARQSITITESTTEHGLDLIVDNGPVEVRIGTTVGAADLLLAAELEDGSHTLSFTPGTGVVTVFLEIRNDQNKLAFVDSAQIAPAGIIVLQHPYTIADLPGLKTDQSNDVIFVASDGRLQQRRIERRSDTSWSIARYKTSDGPFDLLPDQSISIETSANTGNVTLTASQALFTDQDVGSLFRLETYSQRVRTTLVTEGQLSETIRVSGFGTNDREFDYGLTSSGFTGTVILERAANEPVNFTQIDSRTGNTTINNFFDQQNNIIYFYRWRLRDITAGSIAARLDYDGGTTRGVARITSVTSPTVAEAEVLDPFGDFERGTSQWDRSAWSDRNGWPNAVTLFDGRLWWGRRGLVYGSESDAFNAFNDETEGDSAPVVRSIGSNTTDGILWLRGLQRLAAGTNLTEVSVRASSFDEPITATNFVPRDASTRGSANVEAIRVDSDAFYSQRTSDRLMRFAFTPEKNDYFSYDMTELNRDILSAGIKKIDVQRHPDTRIWVLLNNGELRCLVLELNQNVTAWTRIVTDGVVEDFAILPSNEEDRVLVLVRRNINSVDERYIEEMAPLSQAVGGLSARVADSFITGTNGPASATITGLSHLEGEEVVVWATKDSDGTLLVVNQSNMLTVTAGQITVSEAVTDWMVGLPYSGRWKSTKLAFGSAAGTALSQKKRPSHLNLVMQDIYPDGVRAGKAFDSLRRIRERYKGRPLAVNEFLSEYDYDATQINGIWDTDSRICIQIKAPYSATVNALVIHGKENDYGG